MKVNIYDKISQWLLDCPEMGGYSYFNVIPIDAGSSSVNSNSSSIVLNEYMDGAKEVRLMFNINLVREYDNGGTSDLNLDAIAEFEYYVFNKDFAYSKLSNSDFKNLSIYYKELKEFNQVSRECN